MPLTYGKVGILASLVNPRDGKARYGKIWGRPLKLACSSAILHSLAANVRILAVRAIEVMRHRCYYH